MPEAQKLIEQLLQLIPPMRATINLGIQPEAKDCTKNGRFTNQYKDHTLLLMHCLPGSKEMLKTEAEGQGFQHLL